MTSKQHILTVKVNTLQSILELKQAILDQYPSKIKFFIAPEQFQMLMLHGKVFENTQGVNELFIDSHTTHSNTFPENLKQGQIVLLQFPRTDHHLKQIHDIITDESKVIHPLLLSHKLHISMPRVMKIIHFLEASGFIQIDSSPSTLQNTQNSSYQSNLGQIGAIEEESEEKVEIPNDFPFIEHDQQRRNVSQFGSTLPLPSLHSNNVLSPSLQLAHNASTQSLPRLNRSGSFSLSEEDRNLLRSSSFLRAVATEIAEQLLFSDNTEDDNELELALAELKDNESDHDNDKEEDTQPD